MKKSPDILKHLFAARYSIYIYLILLYCYIYIYIYIYVYIYRYIYICNHENNVPSRLSPQWHELPQSHCGESKRCKFTNLEDFKV